MRSRRWRRPKRPPPRRWLRRARRVTPRQVALWRRLTAWSPARRQRGRSRREHGQRRTALPDRGQPAARSHRLGAVLAPVLGEDRPDHRVHDRRTARTHVHGKVMFINPAIDPASRSAKVWSKCRTTTGNSRRRLRQGARRHRQPSGHPPGAREALLNWNLEQQTAESSSRAATRLRAVVKTASRTA